jgi:hypothetical protein
MNATQQNGLQMPAYGLQMPAYGLLITYCGQQNGLGQHILWTEQMDN